MWVACRVELKGYDEQVKGTAGGLLTSLHLQDHMGVR